MVSAKAVRIARDALSRFHNGREVLSPDRLDKAFGADMETLMRMQSTYDIAQARQPQGRSASSAFRRLPAMTRSPDFGKMAIGPILQAIQGM